MNPTQEQIRKFWERLEWIPTKDGFYEHPDGDGTYYDYHTQSKLPVIDLNNLFRYAVPRLIDKYGGILFVLPQSDIQSWECKILNKPSDEATFGFAISNPALALFWAIWEAIEGETIK